MVDERSEGEAQVIVDYYPSASVFIDLTIRPCVSVDFVKYWSSRASPDFRYDKILLGYNYQGQLAPRKAYDIRPDVSIMGDSGGYQMATQGKIFEPVGVLKWLEEYCDIGFTLDLPTWKFRKSTFEKTLESTIKHVEVFARNRNHDSKCKILNIIHGGTPQEVDTWLKAVAPYSDQFDGLATSNSFADYPAIIYRIGKLLEQGAPRVHLFAMGGFETMGTVFYLARKFPKVKFSTDSSTWSQIARYREMLLFDSRVSFGTKKDGIPDVTEMPCECPICSKTDVSSVYSKTEYGSVIIAAHNLYQFLTRFKMLNALSQDERLLSQFLKNSGALSNSWFSAAQYFVENGLEAYTKKFVSGTSTEEFV